MDINTKIEIAKAQAALLSSIGEREFDANETWAWIKARPILPMSWGVSKLTKIANKVFYFKVSGHHHKGFVVITLGWNDTYTVRLVSNKWVEKAKFEEVYCDQLAELIDEKVERINAYKS